VVEGPQPNLASIAFASDAVAASVRDTNDGDVELGTAAWARECARQVELVRDIFGNPFRLSAFSPSWSTSTAVTLAARMYESRDFSAMPMLAEALRDAGCDSADILAHCRGEGPHVRGCWVVDLVLAKVRMVVEDFDGTVVVETDVDLLHRLRSVRRGDLGVFILSHEGADESLWIYINNDDAYLMFYPDSVGGHAGYVSIGEPDPSGERKACFPQLEAGASIGASPDEDDWDRDARVEVRGDGGTFVIRGEHLVPVAVAYAAAQDFLRQGGRPRSVAWLDLEV
jgi:hypothetical protein